jgi:hypothetical protein
VRRFNVIRFGRERRALATGRLRWPDAELIVTRLPLLSSGFFDDLRRYLDCFAFLKHKKNAETRVYILTPSLAVQKLIWQIIWPVEVNRGRMKSGSIICAEKCIVDG